MEIWKPVKNFENLYEVSNIGRVKSLTRTVTQKGNKEKYYNHIYPEKIIVGSYDKKTGYRNVVLYKNGHGTSHKVHRLVAEAFCENPNNYDIVDHKNGRKLDNRANNLRWVTQKENIQNAKDNGHDYTQQPTTGTHNGKKCCIFCEELNKNFLTLREAAIYLKNNTMIEASIETMRKHIHQACTKHKTAYKYHWKFN